MFMSGGCVPVGGVGVRMEGCVGRREEGEGLVENTLASINNMSFIV